MNRRQIGSLAVVALIASATGFLISGQFRAQLINPSNRVARNQALVNSVQELERANEMYRSQISALRTEISGLEAGAARRSEATRQLSDQVAELRGRAGLTTLHGPGVHVELRNGVPGPDTNGGAGYLVNFNDVQDVVNLMFASGAEAISVNGRRLTPVSAFSGSEGEVVIDQGPPLRSPIEISVIGDRSAMVAALSDTSALADIRNRQVRFQLQLTFNGVPDVNLPPYDSSLEVSHAAPL